MGKREGRWEFLSDVIRRNPVMSTCSLAFSVLGAADLIKSQFFPDKYQHWQIVNYLSLWSWKAWFSVVCFLAFIAVWLGAFKKDAEKNVEIGSLKNPLPILSIDIQELFIIPSSRSDVFIAISVTNDSKTETLLKDYRLNLETEVGIYQLDRILGTTTGYARTVINYSDKNQPRIESQSRLEDFDSQVTRLQPLKYGLPVNGWLHFRVEGGTNLQPLQIEMVNKAYLYIKDSCTRSLIHAVAKGAPLDNPSTLITAKGVYI